MPHSCGSCSTIFTVRPETRKLYVAWCGDSRCVLSRNGKSVDLSTDHKPYVPSEVKRIEAAGGHVEDNRVCGKLAVSRALGDYMMKDFKEENPQLKREGQKAPFTADLVVSDADVSETDWKDDDEFVLIASDGLLDLIGCVAHLCLHSYGMRDLAALLCLRKLPTLAADLRAVVIQVAFQSGAFVVRASA